MVDVELVVRLVESALKGENAEMRRAGSEVARLLDGDGHNDQAKRVRRALRQRGAAIKTSEAPLRVPRDDASRRPLVEEISWPTRPSLLDSQAGRAITRFLEDIKHGDALREAGISARLGLLLHGEPGTGKTLLAGHVAEKLGMPIYLARLDALISSRLGETSKNIRGVFDFISAREGILFLDEMDAIAKLRDDKQELGELKRVVNTVLQGMDSLPEHIVVISATNHPHLLDPAIWRRFPYKIELLAPNSDVREQLWSEFLGPDAEKLSLSAEWLARLSEGLTGAEIEQIALAARRTAIVGGHSAKEWELVHAIHSVRSGTGVVIDGADPSPEDKRQVAGILARAGCTAAKCGRVLNISRQMAHRYMKDSIDG